MNKVVRKASQYFEQNYGAGLILYASSSYSMYTEAVEPDEVILSKSAYKKLIHRVIKQRNKPLFQFLTEADRDVVFNLLHALTFGGESMQMTYRHYQFNVELKKQKPLTLDEFRNEALRLKELVQEGGKA